MRVGGLLQGRLHIQPGSTRERGRLGDGKRCRLVAPIGGVSIGWSSCLTSGVLRPQEPRPSQKPGPNPKPRPGPSRESGVKPQPWTPGSGADRADGRLGATRPQPEREPLDRSERAFELTVAKLDARRARPAPRERIGCAWCRRARPKPASRSALPPQRSERDSDRPEASCATRRDTSGSPLRAALPGAKHRVAQTAPVTPVDFAHPALDDRRCRRPARGRPRRGRNTTLSRGRSP